MTKIKRKPFTAPDGFMTRTEAMEYLEISNATIFVWEKRGLLHPVRIGVYTLYPKGELEQVKKQAEAV